MMEHVNEVKEGSAEGKRSMEEIAATSMRLQGNWREFPTTKLDALVDALSESVLEASDDEILDELRESGVDPVAEAARLKKMLLDTVKTFDKPDGTGRETS